MYGYEKGTVKSKMYNSVCILFVAILNNIHICRYYIFKKGTQKILRSLEEENRCESKGEILALVFIFYIFFKIIDIYFQH